MNRAQEFIHGTSTIGDSILHVSLTSLSAEMISFLQRLTLKDNRIDSVFVLPIRWMTPNFKNYSVKAFT